MKKGVVRVLGTLCLAGGALLFAGCGDDYEGRWVRRVGTSVTEMNIDKDDDSYQMHYVINSYEGKENIEKDPAQKETIHNFTYSWVQTGKGDTLLFEKDGKISESALLSYFPFELYYIKDKDALSPNDGRGVYVRKTAEEMRKLQQEAKDLIKEGLEEKYKDGSATYGNNKLGTIVFDDGNIKY